MDLKNNELMEKSKLPDKPDRKFLDSLCIETVSYYNG